MIAKKPVYRTLESGKRYLVVGSSICRSDMVEMRDDNRKEIQKLLPGSEIRIEPRSKPGKHDVWELLVGVEG